MNYYLSVLKNYVTFTGRARRSEYWYFNLFNLIFLVLAAALDNILNLTISPLPYGVFYCLYGLFIFLPSLSVQVRRLHDVNKSGWFILIGLIPLIGAIWLLILYCTEGTEGDNEYGPDPKAMVEVE